MPEDASSQPGTANTPTITEHGVPPKSYAAAAKEPLDEVTAAPSGRSGKAHTFQSGPLTNGHIPPDESLLSPESFKQTSEERPLDEKKVVYQRFTAGHGDSLTSIEPGKDFQDGLRHNEDTRPRDRSRDRGRQEDGPQLATGRKAGAGWEKSA